MVMGAQGEREDNDFKAFVKLTGRFPSEIPGMQPLGIHWLWWVNPIFYEIQFGKKLPELPREWRAHKGKSRK